MGEGPAMTGRLDHALIGAVNHDRTLIANRGFCRLCRERPWASHPRLSVEKSRGWPRQVRPWHYHSMRRSSFTTTDLISPSMRYFVANPEDAPREPLSYRKPAYAACGAAFGQR